MQRIASQWRQPIVGLFLAIVIVATILMMHGDDVIIFGASHQPVVVINGIVQQMPVGDTLAVNGDESVTGALTVGGNAVLTTSNLSGTSGTIAKFTGTNSAGNSSATDDGTTFAINTNKLTVTEASGNTLVAGTLTATNVITGNSATSTGGIVGLVVKASGTSGASSLLANFNSTAQTTSALAAAAVTNGGTFNTTAGALTEYATKSTITSSRSSGANNLTNVALYGTATGAQVNVSLQADAGNVLLNSTSGTTTIGSTIISTATPTANHGSLGTGSSNWWGNVTGVGANTSVTLTYGSSGFTNRSWCIAITNTTTLPEYIVVTNSATAPVFNCINSTTGAAANCDDFTYQCSGQ